MHAGCCPFSVHAIFQDTNSAVFLDSLWFYILSSLEASWQGMVLSQSVRRLLTLYHHGADTQQPPYVLQMLSAAISHLYSPHSECSIAGMYHPGHRWWCGSHASPAAHWKQIMMSKKGYCTCELPVLPSLLELGPDGCKFFTLKKMKQLLVFSLMMHNFLMSNGQPVPT